MRQLIEDCLEFLLKTVAGVFVLMVLAALVLLALFWPQEQREPLPWLGIIGTDIDAKVARQHQLPFSKGVLIERVFSNSPADTSNIVSGDCIVKFNNRIVFGEAQLRDLIFDMDPREKAWMTVYRDGSYYNAMLSLGERPLGNAVSAQAAAWWAAGGPTTLTTNPAVGQSTAIAPPPIVANAPLPHTYRGVCSNCHVIVSNRLAKQPDTQLVAAQKQPPFPGQNLPGATRTIPLEEFTWAGISAETFNPANAAALGLPPNVTGVQVDEVAPGSRGERGGVLAGDLIRELNGFAVYDADSFANLATAQRLTGGVLLISRGGKSTFVTVPEM